MSLKQFVIRAKHRREKFENIDTTDSKSEAEQLVSEYKRAFGSNWAVWFQQRRTKHGQKVEKFILMRNSGATNSAIAHELAMTNDQVNYFAKRLAHQGLIEKRQSGGGPQYTEDDVYRRRATMIRLVARGKKYRALMKEVDLAYVTIRAFFEKVKKPLKHAALTDILTAEEIEKAKELWQRHGDDGTFNKAVVAQIIEPNLARINAKLGQENEARYLGYAIEYAFSMGQQ